MLIIHRLAALLDSENLDSLFIKKNPHSLLYGSPLSGLSRDGKGVAAVSLYLLLPYLNLHKPPELLRCRFILNIHITNTKAAIPNTSLMVSLLIHKHFDRADNLTADRRHFLI